MPNAPGQPEPQSPKEPKKSQNPILNNFLSAAVFGAFDGALLTYLKTAQNLPENLRNPIYLMCVIVMMIVLEQFAFHTALFMHEKHRDELDTSRQARELKELQHKKSIIREEIDLIKLEREKQQAEGNFVSSEATLNVSPVVGTIEAPPSQQTANEKLDLSQYQILEEGQGGVVNRENTQ